MTENEPYVITIDGPSGSGKGSLALRIARLLGFHLLDSGAIYRLAALKMLRQGVDLADEKAVAKVLNEFNIRFEEGDKLSIPYLDDEDVSSQVRLETTGDAASQIAQYPSVRQLLLERQQQCFQPPGLVADGRDMGTVVFPNARIKFFLYASPEIRAQRRHKQLISMGISASIAQLELEISERDERDRNRSESPLVASTDALVVDSSLLDLNQVTELMISHIEEVNQNRPL